MGFQSFGALVLYQISLGFVPVSKLDFGGSPVNGICLSRLNFCQGACRGGRSDWVNADSNNVNLKIN